VKLLRADLDENQHKQRGQEDEGAGQVAEIHGHRDRVATGFTKRRGEDLDDPEAEGDGGDLA